MTTTTIILVNLILSLLALAAVGGLVRLAHRLPDAAPADDEDWGKQTDYRVTSTPLPLEQIARHDAERALALAA
jgi:hypothetical protein